MPSKSWITLIKDNFFAVSVGVAIIFFIILYLFYKPISAWLKGKKDFSLGRQSQIKARPITKKNETKCRDIFESIFQRPFLSVRPNFLKRANGYALELD